MAVKCILTGQTPSVLDGVTENVQTQLNDKVDKVTGKGLSTNGYTSAEKTKLSGIETGAQKNTITGVKGSAETTYRTGNVNITATNIGLGNVDNTSDANKPISTATKTALDGKQAKVTGAATTITDSNLTADRALISNSSGKVAVSSVTSTELGYLDGVTSNIQTQLNNKLSSAPVASVNNKTGAVTLAKGDVGLGNVDNTSDANKPISNATQAALNDKQSKITANGILKGNGTGGVSAAVKGTDYFTPADVNEIAAEAAKKVDISDKVSKSGDTMTGKLTVPQVETGADNSNFFQCRKFRGEGDANTYYHAIDFGYQNHDRVDFHEYGGIWSFYKNQTGKANDGVLCGSITSNGWEGRAKLKSGSTMVTSQLTENSDAIATTAFVHGLVDNVKHYSASNPPPYPVTSVNNKTGAVTLAKGDVGLGNVDNTSDANKPISNATQAALNNKQAKITAKGLLKGNGNGVVTAADETEVELVDLPQQVFWATYGKTTPAELNAAWNAGKLIKLKQGPTSYELGIKDGNKAYFYGVLINSGDGSVRRAKLDLKNGTWEQDTIGSVCDIVQTISLPTASWTGSDPYTQTVSIFNSNAKTKVDIQPSEEVYDQLVADNVGYLAIKNVNGTLTAVAKGGKPSVDLTVQVTYNNVY